jgi:hypothetical protein
MKPINDIDDELFVLNIKSEKSLFENDNIFAFSILKHLVSVLFFDDTE